MSNLSAVARGA